MLEKISLIASFISALSSITTSLRAVGKSQEYSVSAPGKVSGVIRPYHAVTLIWLILSLIFAVPSMSEAWAGGKSILLLLWSGFFLLIVILNWIIWEKIKSRK